MAAVLGVTVSSGEFRHATATLTYLVAPRRDRVLAAKSVGRRGRRGGVRPGRLPRGRWPTALIIASARGYHVVALGDAHAGPLRPGHILAAALLAAIGVGLGSLVRSQLAAVIGVFVWAIVVESIVGGLFHAVQPYLPYTAATTLSGGSARRRRVRPGARRGHRRHPAPVRGRRRAARRCWPSSSRPLAARTTVPRDVS